MAVRFVTLKSDQAKSPQGIWSWAHRLLLDLNKAFDSVSGSGGSSDYISPMDYNAVGDTTANDYNAVLNAINAAIALGKPLDGGENVYGVDGNLQITGAVRPHIRRLRLKQINPVLNRKTLYFLNCDHVRIDDLYIHTGDNTSLFSNFNNTYGFSIEGGSGHYVKRAEITGSGMLTGARFCRCVDSLFDAVYVHDMNFAATYDTTAGTGDVGGDATNGYFGVADDRLIGISFMECVGCELRSPVVKNLLGNAQAYTQSSRGSTPRTVKNFTNHQTRGIVCSGETDCTVTNPQVDNVGQGLDITGSQGHVNLQILGGHVKHCGTGGVNCKSNTRRAVVRNTIVENAGTYCFYVGGGNYLGASTDNTFNGCIAINPGYNDMDNDLDGEGGVPIPNASVGFLVYRNDTAGTPPAPSGIQFLDCHAIDDQGFYFADVVGGYPTSRADDDPTIVPSGTTSLEMTAPWTGYSQTINGTFVDGTVRAITLTNGSTHVTFPALTSNITNSSGSRSNFVRFPAKMQYGFLGEGPAEAANVVGRGSTSKGHVIADIHNLTDNR